MANIPEDLKYTKSHEWLKEEDGLLVVGLTDFAATSLGDIVFIRLPEVDDEVTAGESFADVESVKAVSDVYSPVTGKVVEINEELLDAPEKVNEDPYVNLKLVRRAADFNSVVEQNQQAFQERR